VSTILSILLFTSPVFAQDSAAVAKAAAACGPADVQLDVSTDKNKHPAATPDGGKALVYVVEVYEKLVDTINIGSPTTKVGLDGAWVGANKGNSYFFFFVDPGEHHLCANWQSHLRRVSKLVSLAGFKAEAGKAYYFRARIIPQSSAVGGQVASLELEPVNSDDGQLLVASSSFSTSHPRK